MASILWPRSSASRMAGFCAGDDSGSVTSAGSMPRRSSSASIIASSRFILASSRRKRVYASLLSKKVIPASSSAKAPAKRSARLSMVANRLSFVVSFSEGHGFARVIDLLALAGKERDGALAFGGPALAVADESRRAVHANDGNPAGGRARQDG